MSSDALSFFYSFFVKKLTWYEGTRTVTEILQKVKIYFSEEKTIKRGCISIKGQERCYSKFGSLFIIVRKEKLKRSYLKDLYYPKVYRGSIKNEIKNILQVGTISHKVLSKISRCSYIRCRISYRSEFTELPPRWREISKLVCYVFG